MGRFYARRRAGFAGLDAAALPTAPGPPCTALVSIVGPPAAWRAEWNPALVPPPGATHVRIHGRCPGQPEDILEPALVAGETTSEFWQPDGSFVTFSAAWSDGEGNELSAEQPWGVLQVGVA